MSYPVTFAEKWLKENRDSFHSPFYILLKYLVSMNKELTNGHFISCHEYEKYFRDRCFINEFPFKVESPSIADNEDIIQFIDEFDHASLSKMINGVFVALIRFLVNQKGRLKILDIGTGKTCGMYGESGRFLFECGDVNIDGINFYGIDELQMPGGAIFKNSAYFKCNVLDFHPQQTFNLITGHHVIEHCVQWEDVVRHIARLLDNDGYLYLSFPRFGGFYDTVYRIMSPFDHCANFELDRLKMVSEEEGLEMCLSDIYVDPNGRFDWMCNIFPELVDRKMSLCFYDLCVRIDAKLLLGYHLYGHYAVFRKRI